MNHLKTCPKRVSALNAGQSRLRSTKLFHLLIEGHYLPHYWIHLEITASSPLQTLDDFLRATWVECCGHLSKFIIQKQVYSSDYVNDQELYDAGTNVRLQSVLRPDLRFGYSYDFGTPTDLTLTVLSERVGRLPKGSFQILARNSPPLITCDSCKQPATQVCGICIWEGRGWLCSKCAKNHKCGEDMLLPVVNSPRVGICGYHGPIK